MRHREGANDGMAAPMIGVHDWVRNCPLAMSARSAILSCCKLCKKAACWRMTIYLVAKRLHRIGGAARSHLILGGM